MKKTKNISKKEFLKKLHQLVKSYYFTETPNNKGILLQKIKVLLHLVGELIEENNQLNKSLENSNKSNKLEAFKQTIYEELKFFANKRLSSLKENSSTEKKLKEKADKSSESENTL